MKHIVVQIIYFETLKLKDKNTDKGQGSFNFKEITSSTSNTEQSVNILLRIPRNPSLQTSSKIDWQNVMSICRRHFWLGHNCENHIWLNIHRM